MIEQLRSRRGKIIIQYIVIGLAASMILGSVISPLVSWFTGGDTNKSPITVNGHEISAREVQIKAMSYEQQIEAIRQQFGEQASLFLRMIGYDRNPQDLALESAIQNAILSSAAESSGLTHLSTPLLQRKIGDHEFSLYYLHPIIDHSMYNHFGKMDETALQERLSRFGMNYDDLIDETRHALQRKLYTDLAYNAFYLPDHEVRAAYLKDHVARTFSYLLFNIEPYAQAIRNEGVSRSTLRTFFDQENASTKRYWKPEHRSGVYWSFSPENYGLTIRDDAIDAYYQKHKQSYVKHPAQVELHHIFLQASQENRGRIYEQAHNVAQELQQHPENFSQKARSVSDADDADNGGYIGFVTRRDSSYNDRMLQAAFSLEQDGDVSDPIEVGNGFEIVGRVSRKKATYQPKEEVADEIRTILQRQKFEQRFKQDANQAKQQGGIEDFISRRNGVRQDIPSVSRQMAESQQQAALFTKLDTVGKYTVFMDGNIGYIVQLTNISPAYLPSFDEQIDQVQEDYVYREAYQRMQSDAHHARDMINDQNATIDQVAERFDVSVNHAHVNGDHNHSWSQLNTYGLPTQRMQYMIHAGYAIEHTQAQKACVVMLNTIDGLDEESYMERKSSIYSQIYQNQQNQYIDAFIASLHTNATIEYSKELQKQMNQ